MAPDKPFWPWHSDYKDPFSPPKQIIRPLYPPQIGGENLIYKPPAVCCSSPGFQGYVLPVPGWVTADQALDFSGCTLKNLLLGAGMSNVAEVVAKIKLSQGWLDCVAQANGPVTLAVAPCTMHTPVPMDYQAANAAGLERPICASFFAFVGSGPGSGDPASKTFKFLADELVYVGPFAQSVQAISICAFFYEQYAKAAAGKFKDVINFADGSSYLWPDFYNDWVAQHGIPLDTVECVPECDGNTCGPDGCGGTCGECAPEEGFVCDSGVCKKCGDGWAYPDQWKVEDGACVSSCVAQDSGCGLADSALEHVNCAWEALKYLLATKQIPDLGEKLQEAKAAMGGVDGLTVYMGTYWGGHVMMAIRFSNWQAPKYMHKKIHFDAEWNPCITAYHDQRIQANAAWSDVGSKNGPWNAQFDNWLMEKDAAGNFLHFWGL